MDYTGFLKLHRKMLSWEWYGNINTKIVFLHLLLLANWIDKKWQGNVIKRGQLVSTPDKISKKLGLSVQQVKTAIKNLKRTNEITSKGTNRYTIYTVINYDLYQNHNTDNNQQENDQITNEQPTSNKRTTTTKENKEVKNSPFPLLQQVGEENKGEYLKGEVKKNYHAILDCWKEERNNAGLTTGLIGENSKKGAIKLASAIDKNEITLPDVRKAIHSLLANTEKRKTYSLLGLANNIEIWLNHSSPAKKTIQLNQTNNVVYYFGVCENCGYSMTGFKEGLAICQKCKTQIKLRKDNYGK